jgi:hypothetical protein
LGTSSRIAAFSFLLRFAQYQPYSRDAESGPMRSITSEHGVQGRMLAAANLLGQSYFLRSVLLIAFGVLPLRSSPLLSGHLVLPSERIGRAGVSAAAPANSVLQWTAKCLLSGHELALAEDSAYSGRFILRRNAL